jgi:Fur family transcriptional regulator, zinc uptake regulator
MVRKGTKRRPAPEQDKMIVEALRGVGRPVSAYELIDRLREKATLAPQTVYRSLDRLIADGQAHRLESLNAFVACRHPSHEGAAVFAICDDCGTVTEFDEPVAVERLAGWAKKAKFAVDQMTLELRGRCRTCAARPAPAQ